MIVRILEQGQYELDDAHLPALEALDANLDQAIAADDEREFATMLAALHNLVHEFGHPLPADAFVTSDFALPAAGSTLGEVRTLLASD